MPIVKSENFISPQNKKYQIFLHQDDENYRIECHKKDELIYMLEMNQTLQKQMNMSLDESLEIAWENAKGQIISYENKLAKQLSN